MTARAAKPSNDPIASLAIESDELHQPEVNAFIARNRDALHESIRRSREEFAKGVYSKRTISDIIADGRKRHGGT